MSRSRKKHAIIGNKSKFNKKYYNRKFRRIFVDEEVCNGKWYRKKFNSYFITDTIMRWDGYDPYFDSDSEFTPKEYDSPKNEYYRWYHNK